MAGMAYRFSDIYQPRSTTTTRSGEIMHLVASVCPFVWALLAEPFDLFTLIFGIITDIVIVCFSNTREGRQLIPRMQSIGFNTFNQMAMPITEISALTVQNLRSPAPPFRNTICPCKKEDGGDFWNELESDMVLLHSSKFYTCRSEESFKFLKDGLVKNFSSKSY